MSYSPTTWASGDTITAAKLNKLEQGISAATATSRLYLCTEDANHTLNHSYNDIKAALLANKEIFIYRTESPYTFYDKLTAIGTNSSSNYWISTYNNNYSASTATANLETPK